MSNHEVNFEKIWNRNDVIDGLEWFDLTVSDRRTFTKFGDLIVKELAPKQPIILDSLMDIQPGDVVTITSSTSNPSKKVVSSGAVEYVKEVQGITKPTFHVKFQGPYAAVVFNDPSAVVIELQSSLNLPDAIKALPIGTLISVVFSTFGDPFKARTVLTPSNEKALLVETTTSDVGAILRPISGIVKFEVITDGE